MHALEKSRFWGYIGTKTFRHLWRKQPVKFWVPQRRFKRQCQFSWNPLKTPNSKIVPLTQSVCVRGVEWIVPLCLCSAVGSMCTVSVYPGGLWRERHGLNATGCLAGGGERHRVVHSVQRHGHLRFVVLWLHPPQIPLFRGHGALVFQGGNEDVGGGQAVGEQGPVETNKPRRRGKDVSGSGENKIEECVNRRRDRELTRQLTRKQTNKGKASQ